METIKFKGGKNVSVEIEFPKVAQFQVLKSAPIINEKEKEQRLVGTSTTHLFVLKLCNTSSVFSHFPPYTFFLENFFFSLWFSTHNNHLSLFIQLETLSLKVGFFFLDLFSSLLVNPCRWKPIFSSHLGSGFGGHGEAAL